MIIGDLGLLSGLAFIAFGVFRFGWQEGAPVFVGIMLVGFSVAVLLPRIADLEPPEPSDPTVPPDGGNRLPPAQESALSVQDVEREKVLAIGHRENVARA
jgi:hypothetical protein